MHPRNLNISPYLYSYKKRVLDIFLSLFILLLISPAFILIAIMVLITSGWPIFYLQNRRGLNGRTFKIIKFRTMVKNASGMQKKYKSLNESDGPVFKIKNDPRFTKIGRLLSNVGLDELPQFVNVILGQMSIVGPRPLPVIEAARLSKDQQIREFIRPGCTSNWVIQGSHNLTFKKWMKLDKVYVYNANFKNDLVIIFNTFRLIVKYLLNQFTNH